MKQKLTESPFARLLVTIFGMPLVLGIVVLIGFKTLTNAHIVNAAEHLNETENALLLSVPGLTTDVKLIETRIDDLDVGAARSDERIGNMETTVKQLQKIYTNQDDKFTTMIGILERIERNSP